MNLILEAIDKINVITSQGFLAGFLAGDESGQSWDMISVYLYQLLGKLLKLACKFAKLRYLAHFLQVSVLS